MVWQGTVNPPTQVTTGSIPVISTNFIKQIDRQASVFGEDFSAWFLICDCGGMEYAIDLKSIAFGIKGSSPFSRTNLGLKCSWTHTALSLPKSGDRYPLDPPSFISRHQPLETGNLTGNSAVERGVEALRDKKNLPQVRAVPVRASVTHPLDTISPSWNRNQHYYFSVLPSIINKQERYLLSRDNINGVRGSVLN